MASSIKYPEEDAVWFIEGDILALLTNVESLESNCRNCK